MGLTAAGPGHRLRARRIAAAYIGISLVWIVASDYVVEGVAHLPYVPMAKGILFVVTTGALLYVLLSRWADSIETSQSELLASEERFRNVVENAPLGIFIQTGGVFRYLNPAGSRLLGAESPGQLVGHSMMERIAPAFREIVRKRIDTLNQGRPVPPMAQKWLKLDGSMVDAELLSVAFELDGKKGTLVFFTDISGRLKSEEERRALEEQVRQAQRMESIGRLAGGVAHDFNNLLTIINGYSEILTRRIPPGDWNHDPAVEIHNAGERAVGITRQLLALSRKDPVAPKVLDPNAIIRETERMIRRLLGENVTVSIVLADGVGMVLSDTGSLTQVLLNLAANARDAMPRGGAFTIETGLEQIGQDRHHRVAGAREGLFVRITARDTGCGMDEQTRQRMFDPFFTTKASGEGTGLGLSIVYGIVKGSSGWIEVETNPGTGTSISILLPALGDVRPDAAGSRGEAAPEGHETILLVEDEPAVRGLAQAVLSGAGYRVISCGNADEALAQFEQSREGVDLLLTDVVMPGRSGTELARLLADRSPGMQVVLMSGYSRENLTPSATSSHRAFLPKPFSAAALLSVVRRVLDERAAKPTGN